MELNASVRVDNAKIGPNRIMTHITHVLPHVLGKQCHRTYRLQRALPSKCPRRGRQAVLHQPKWIRSKNISRPEVEHF
jgi:hypothetical protein